MLQNHKGLRIGIIVFLVVAVFAGFALDMEVFLNPNGFYSNVHWMEGTWIETFLRWWGRDVDTLVAARPEWYVWFIRAEISFTAPWSLFLLLCMWVGGEFEKKWFKSWITIFYCALLFVLCVVNDVAMILYYWGPLSWIASLLYLFWTIGPAGLLVLAWKLRKA